MNALVKAAFQYKEHGYSIVPISAGKRSFLDWQPYQFEIMDDFTITKEFSKSHVIGIAVVCGNVSGNFQLIDIDSKNDLKNTLFADFSQRLSEKDDLLLHRLAIASTTNNGYHLYYRCPVIGRHKTLARRPCTKKELSVSPKLTMKVLIEAIEEGGYALVPPSRRYRFVNRSLLDIPTITPAEREVLIDVARSFHTFPEQLDRIYIPQSSVRDHQDPLTDYDLDINRKRNITDLLIKHDWRYVEEIFPRTYFRRPGKTDHRTSGDYDEELNLFTVFTTSTKFIRSKGYKPSQVFAFLECNEDFKLAAKRLLAAGYGVPYNKRA